MAMNRIVVSLFDIRQMFACRRGDGGGGGRGGLAGQFIRVKGRRGTMVTRGEGLG